MISTILMIIFGVMGIAATLLLLVETYRVFTDTQMGYAFDVAIAEKIGKRNKEVDS